MVFCIFCLTRTRDKVNKNDASPIDLTETYRNAETLLLASLRTRGYKRVFILEAVMSQRSQRVSFELARVKPWGTFETQISKI